jgi:hypothetical protein
MMRLFLTVLTLLFATPAMAQPDSREQAMAKLWLKACLDNNNDYDAVRTLAQNSGWESTDPNTVPFRLYYDRTQPPKPLAWKADGFAIIVAPKSPVRGSGRPQKDSCSVQGFDLEMDKTVTQLRIDQRLTFVVGDHRSAAFLANSQTPNAFQVVVRLWAKAIGAKKGQLALLIGPT